VLLLFLTCSSFVHELGHFLAARWRGLKIERSRSGSASRSGRKRSTGSSIGPRLDSRGRLCGLPQMPRWRRSKARRTEQEQLPPVSGWIRSSCLCRTLFSLFAGIVFCDGVWKHRPTRRRNGNDDHDRLRGPGSPAEAAGLKAKRHDHNIDGKAGASFRSIGDTVMWRIVSSEGETVPVRWCEMARKSR